MPGKPKLKNDIPVETRKRLLVEDPHGDYPFGDY